MYSFIDAFRFLLTKEGNVVLAAEENILNMRYCMRGLKEISMANQAKSSPRASSSALASSSLSNLSSSVLSITSNQSSINQGGNIIHHSIIDETPAKPIAQAHINQPIQLLARVALLPDK